MKKKEPARLGRSLMTRLSPSDLRATGKLEKKGDSYDNPLKLVRATVTECFLLLKHCISQSEYLKQKVSKKFKAVIKMLKFKKFH